MINAEVQKARYCHGLYIRYTSFGEEKPTETEVKSDTLSPVFNHNKIYSFPAVAEEHLNWFETGSLSFSLYAKQNDQIVDVKLAKLTTKVIFLFFYNLIMDYRINGSAAEWLRRWA